MKNIVSQLKTGFILMLVLSVITGLVYPSVTTVIAQLFCPWKANGSLLIAQGKIIGSELIGQSFSDAKYFWGRPSATTPYPYNASNSTGSNLAPSNPSFVWLLQERILKLRQADAQNTQLIPVDLITASGSGLDPEISPAAAFYQVTRIAKARNISEQQLELLVNNSIKKRSFGLLGEQRVNVLKLNLALDQMTERMSYERSSQSR